MASTAELYKIAINPEAAKKEIKEAKDKESLAQEKQIAREIFVRDTPQIREIITELAEIINKNRDTIENTAAVPQFELNRSIAMENQTLKKVINLITKGNYYAR